MDELKALLTEINAAIDSSYPTNDFAEGILEGLKEAAEMLQTHLTKV